MLLKQTTASMAQNNSHQLFSQMAVHSQRYYRDTSKDLDSLQVRQTIVL